MSVVLLLLVPVVCLLACAVAMIWVPLPRFFPPPLSQGRNLMAAIITGILGMGYLIGVAVYVTSLFLHAGRVLDRVCASLGLTAQGYLAFGRQYHGSIQGRQVSVDYLPGQGTSPALLNTYVDADLGTRMAIGRQKPLLDCRGCSLLHLGAPGLAHLQIIAQEETKARSLLADLEVQTTLIHLIPDQESLGLKTSIQELYLQPDRVWLRSRPRQVSETQFRQWFDDLLALIEAVEEIVSS